MTRACPSFSIVIPTFQRRSVVSETVRALGGLDYAGKLEAIVVVDGSTDGTAAELRRLKLPFPLLVLEQTNRGAAAARNRGVENARGDIILFLDDDMIVTQDLVEQHAKMYLDNADAVVGQIPVHDSSPSGFITDSAKRWFGTCRTGNTLTPFDIFTGQLSVRRLVFTELGRFDEEYTSGGSFKHEDTELGVRLLAKYRVLYNPAAISFQKYVVPAAEVMKRAAQAAWSDLKFLHRHPEYCEMLYGHRGRDVWKARVIYWPLSAVPGLSKAVSKSAVFVANGALKTRFRSSILVSKFFGFAQGLTYWTALRKSGLRPKGATVLVLAYHAIMDQSDDPLLAPYGVPPEAFEEHLRWLSKRMAFITPQQFADFIEHGCPLPRRSVLLTFDDGYSDLLGVSKTILAPRGIEAVAFAVTGMKSLTNEWDQEYGARPIRLLRPDELAEMRKLGIETGCHSRTHREMPMLVDEQLRSETRGAADDLTAAGLLRPRFFAYPFGSYDARCERAVQSGGYLAAFTCRNGRVSAKSARYALPRVTIYARDRGLRFGARIRAPRVVAFVEHTWQRMWRLAGRAV